MKKMKLALVAVLATFEALCATGLEYIKNAEFSGYAGYRYEASSWAKNSQDLEAGGITSRQEHRFKSALGVGFDTVKSFKIYG